MDFNKLEDIRNKENLGPVFKMVRISLNLKAAEFAKNIAVAPAYVNAIENNDRKPSLRLLRDILIFYGLTENQLIRLIDFYNNYQGPNKYTHTLYETVKVIVSNMNS